MSKYIESNIIEYNNVRKITGFECICKHETDTCYYIKEFRYSNDNILWSDYKLLNNSNLLNINTNENKLYVQYRFTPTNDETKLDVESISLKVLYSNDVDNPIPNCYWNTISTNRYSPQIVYNTSSNKNLFNPYSIGSGLSFYKQMSTLVSNMFGICVLYFKTEPNSHTRDVVLKEYSIEKVINKQNVKILIPDNQLPTKELQFSPLMIDMNVQFEVHIVKSEFQKIFGANSHPDPHDYLYFQTYMNRMYMVDAVSEPDDFGYTCSYWRVSLVPYQDLSSVKYDDDDLQNDTETLYFSAEGKFKDEVEDEMEDTRKDNQLNDMGDWMEGQDFLRRYLNPNVRIKQEKIYNDWTVVADSYYDLSTIEKGEKVVEYKYTKGFSSQNERMLSFIYKPDMTKSKSDNISILSIGKGDNGGVKLIVQKWNDIFKKGNLVKLSRTSNLNGLKKIIYVNKGKRIIEIDGEYDSDKTKLFNCARLIGYELNNMFNINNDKTIYMSLSQMENQIIMNFNGDEKYYTFEKFKGFETKWYAILLGMKNGMSNIWLYEFDGSDKEENMKSKLKFISRSSNDLGEFNFGETCYYDLISCNAKLTNLRLWSELCEEDKHNIILSEIIVDDTHNTLIVDNAKSELLLNNKYS